MHNVRPALKGVSDFIVVFGGRCEIGHYGDVVSLSVGLISTVDEEGLRGWGGMVRIK